VCVVVDLLQAAVSAARYNDAVVDVWKLVSKKENFNTKQKKHRKNTWQ